jgi:hypothetical protein
VKLRNLLTIPLFLSDAGLQPQLILPFSSSPQAPMQLVPVGEADRLRPT